MAREPSRRARPVFFGGRLGERPEDLLDRLPRHAARPQERLPVRLREVDHRALQADPARSGIEDQLDRVAELERDIADRLRESFLQDPQVTVFIQEFASQRVTVEGSVNQPGIKSLTGRTTLLQLIAMSGGLTRMADPSKIIVFRTIDGQRMVALFDLVDIRSGLAEDPQIYGDDIVVVDDSRARTVAETLRTWMGFRPWGM
jgi:hypothetical protein